MKMFITVAIAVVMLFAVAGLAACEIGGNPTIEEYRITAIEALETYATNRGQSNFTEANWLLVEGHVAYGTGAIKAAETKTAVRTARYNAKAAVRAVPREVVMEITEEALGKIRQDYLNKFDRQFHFDRFYGLFNGSAVFFIEADDASVKTVIIAGETFTANSQWTILVWNAGNFYNLEDIDNIFVYGILTRENLSKIVTIHNNYAI